ncbi:MAG: HAMP domain-containing protein [Ignavibacteriae bacterium]|nr:HAMP domain-containing protein [Ignavibacteriota bacterium]
MAFWNQSIRTKLTFWYSLLVLSTLVAFGVASYWFTSNTLSTNLDLSLKIEVGWVKDFIQPQASKVKPSKRSIDALLQKKSKLLPQAADTLQADTTAEAADEIWNHIFKHTLVSPKKTYIQVEDRHGAIIYRNYSLGGDTLAVSDSVGVNTTHLTTTLLNGEPVRAAITRDKNFSIIVAYPLRELGEVLENLFSIFLILIPIALAVSVFGGLYLANKSLKPVDRITTHARKITAENLDQKIAVRNVNDEIGRLTATINEMIQRLHESFAQIRQFSADASHELRTPLTIMRGEIELSLRSLKTPEEYRRVLASSLEEILRMTSIIDNLLTLGKADQGVYELNLEEVGLEEIVRDLHGDSEVLAEPKNIKVTIKKIEPITIIGDKVRLRQLFINLIDNAIKYSHIGGSVTLSVERQNGTALFRVEDTGIGIPEQDLERIFDRFYRVDKARSRELGGTGLGLSIAKWIAGLHRGTITVTSELDKGSVFTVQLPLN